MSTATDEPVERTPKCPEPGGRFGEHWRAYGQSCSYDCAFKDECRHVHDRLARRRREANKLPRYLTIELGLLMDRKLNANKRLIIALVHFRAQGRDGHSYDKNVAIARLLGVSSGRVSHLMSSLVEDGYLVTEFQVLRAPKSDKVRSYRTSRKIGLGIRAVEAINAYKLDKDRLARVYSGGENV